MMKMTILKRAGIAATVVLASATIALADEPKFDAAEREELGDLIRQYILDNPEIILEAVNILNERAERAKAEEQRGALSALRSQIFENPMTPVSGNPDGDVTIVEFFDYQCGFCKRVFPAVMNTLQNDQNVRVIWKELPILGDTSRFASEAAMAAALQGRYLEFHTALMGYRGRLNQQIVIQKAEELGLDMERLQADMHSPEIQQYLDSNLKLAQDIGVSGTPAMIIGDKLVPGAVSAETLASLIEEARSDS